MNFPHETATHWINSINFRVNVAQKLWINFIAQKRLTTRLMTQTQPRPRAAFSSKLLASSSPQSVRWSIYLSNSEPPRPPLPLPLLRTGEEEIQGGLIRTRWSAGAQWLLAIVSPLRRHHAPTGASDQRHVVGVSTRLQLPHRAVESAGAVSHLMAEARHSSCAHYQMQARHRVRSGSAVFYS
jgi:hypothetical protein